ncbi:polysaccharide lyase family 8 super-sandwich domain-containing protein [Chryseosolibacter indicus]|uniref:Chondroitin lyase n=1 Tax=Chryseosolibacter indicus TaxID=2782351 RepID=A0ABS5VQ12_9BACT|nr:polysaccharide lyase family 8 super-sandwich domain-containing protein [Chryseosolibacter indicus]MBT1703539.1 chondroitin lyase [Chryseosolibacter indicus]
MHKILFVVFSLFSFSVCYSFAEPTSQVSVLSQTSSDLETIRARIIEDLLAPAIDEERISHLIKSIQPDGSWGSINYKDVSRTGFQHSEHLTNMLELSRALKKKGSPFYKNQEVSKAAHAALDFWIAHDFICDNWWWNEMGTPNLMINTLLVLDIDLTEKEKTEGLRIAGRANLEGFGARPGGDLIQIAGMLGKQALFKRDEATLERVVNVMASEIKVTTGRGLKPDMSFHHRVDNVISTLTYGTGYASAFSYWAVKIAGTRFKFPDEAMKLLIDYYLDGICRSLAFATYPDPGAKNRDLSRRGTSNPVGNEIAENLKVASDYRRADLENIIKIRNGEQKPNLSWDHFFWHSEYFTHQRPAYFTSVRMHSSRNHSMEEPHNEEGLKNHHVADGSNFVAVTGKEYAEIFPVWDWQKIPGTTVVQKPALPHWKEIAKKGLTDFVGGVSDGQYGAAAFDFVSPLDPLRARKSWFFFDGEYVCLGAGITSESDYKVLTTVNQCLLNGEVTVKTKVGELKLDNGTNNLKDVNWIHHDGVTYLFPVSANINLTNTTATGNYRAINHHTWATEEPIEKEVFTAWFDHGQKPKGASYAYIVIPATELSSINSYKQDKIVILSNTPELQGVMNKELQQSELVFFTPGKISLPGGVSVEVENPCMVMLKTKGNALEKLSVSDPTRKLKTLRLKVGAKMEGKGDNWKATWSKHERQSTIEISLPEGGYAGQSVVINISGK